MRFVHSTYAILAVDKGRDTVYGVHTTPNGLQQMSKPLVAQIIDAIKDHAYIPTDSHYHKALAVRNAMRYQDQMKKLIKVREALKQYRVSAWFTDNGSIRLCADGKDILVLN